VIDYFVSGTTLLFEIGDALDRGRPDIFQSVTGATTLDQFDLQGN
jgi:hypothetical protein